MGNILETSTNKLNCIPDMYFSLEEVEQALRIQGVESSNLIIGIDYTKSNSWNGLNSYGGKSLHSIDKMTINPYQDVIRIMGRTLESFDEDNLIPTYGFGDILTKNRAVFNLHDINESCNGFEEVLQVYNKKTPYIQLSGPTSFAPIIYEAIRLVQLDNTYHILVIIADGQVSNPDRDIAAITEASQYPLSIIMVGVGDGPWDMMECFDDKLTDSRFDNFQFVNYTEIKKKYGEYSNLDAIFAMNALMEIPMQYKFIKENGLMNLSVENRPMPSAPPNSPIGGRSNENICAICLENNNDHVFQCGHMICGDCKDSIDTCHICREAIQNITRVYM